ncbi:GntR family transcriptional regulator [Streptomyces winkii]|uniref:GntR family transcriptional regulator n=1 Tax=Streptomyces winkii TaxID=3051178 RepID=UPI0028D31B78|nr:GntR family transcriptional regulator [Streptomyces sp. DSM 40971]
MPHTRTTEARSTRAHIVSLLREAIIEGRLQPGARLRQDRLSEEYGVSATPIREALRQLESEGLVVHEPNRGAFVAEVTAHELRGLLLPLRLQLESYAAHQVLEAPPAGLDAELDQIISGMYAAADRNDLRAVTDADVHFHRVLVEAAGSVHAMQLWSGIESRLRLQFYGFGHPEHRLREIADEHRDLLDALRSKDVAKVDAALREHVVDAVERLLGERTERETAGA